ncbi:MAG: divalent-cation tolerance protein CutA [Pirellula sp.]|nr:divalent-cation tolerance protein CutA [Pirellula sp.]
MIEISTTLPNQETAATLAREIIEQSLGACAQVSGPVVSTYRWQGSTETSQEWKLVVKTTDAMKDGLVEYLRCNHPYELPEIVSHTVSWVEPQFADWVRSQTDR